MQCLSGYTTDVHVIKKVKTKITQNPTGRAVIQISHLQKHNIKQKRNNKTHKWFFYKISFHDIFWSRVHCDRSILNFNSEQYERVIR